MGATASKWRCCEQCDCQLPRDDQSRVVVYQGRGPYPPGNIPNHRRQKGGLYKKEVHDDLL